MNEWLSDCFSFFRVWLWALLSCFIFWLPLYCSARLDFLGTRSLSRVFPAKGNMSSASSRGACRSARGKNAGQPKTHRLEATKIEPSNKRNLHLTLKMTTAQLVETSVTYSSVFLKTTLTRIITLDKLFTNYENKTKQTPLLLLNLDAYLHY